MKQETTSRYVEIGANVGVILGIVLLAYEVKSE